MTKLTDTIIIATSLSLVATNIFWFKQNYSFRQIADLSVGVDLTPADRITILPKIIQQANQTEDPKAAIAYHNLAIDTALELAESFSLSPQDKLTIDNTLAAAKQAKVKLTTTQLKTLARELEAGNFGKIKELASEEGENQYTSGAIQTTYQIIMSRDGHHGDLNGDGYLNSTEEIERIPCQTLINIEQLWRKHTSNRCGWVEPNSSSFSSLCSELEHSLTYNTIEPHSSRTTTKITTNNLTLLSAIFNPIDFDFIEPKLQVCLAHSPI